MSKEDVKLADWIIFKAEYDLERARVILLPNPAGINNAFESHEGDWSRCCTLFIWSSLLVTRCHSSISSTMPMPPFSTLFGCYGSRNLNAVNPVSI
ncbi:hypothetical protein M5689_024234 [Euphorbia peplus]|nr:hypothetical protein M5689_024234 [Euphorbia peplus]